MTNPAPTVGDVFTTWTLAPVGDALVVCASVAYLLLAHRHGRWPLARTAAWAGAMVLLVLVLNSAVALYSDNLFWVHMLVHLTMITVVPALLVWAQPLRLWHDTANERSRAMLDRIRSTVVFRVLVSPRFTLPCYVAVIVLTHLTGFQQAMSQHMWIHDAELVAYLVSGYLLLLPLVGDELVLPRPVAYPLRLVVLGVCMGPDTLVGVTLMMTGTAVAPAYAASRDWGPSALTDQSVAGAIMWFGGDGLMMVLMVIVAGLWVRSGDGAASLGPWLDGVRRRATLGESDTDAAGLDASGVDTAGIDDEQAALDAYNQRLAQMYQRDRRS